MAEIKISAEKRTEFGKGAARRIRRADKIPAVLYERGIDPIHVTLPGHETMLALKQPNVLLSIDLGDEDHLAIPKQVQRDPLKGFIEHVDLYKVKRGERVKVEVPVTIVGEPESGVLVVAEHPTVALEVEATHIPSEVEVSVEGLDVGAQILAGDITLPEGAELADEADLLLVNLTHAPTAAEVEAELESAEAEAGIEHEAPAASEGESESTEG